MLKKGCGWLLGLGLILVLGGCAFNGPTISSPVGGLKLGSYREEMRLSREDAVAKYNYCPTGGCVVRLESVEVKPSQAHKGEDLTLTTSYTILTPEQVAIPVTISREMFFQGKSLGKVKDTDTRNYNGTWSHQTDISLAADAAPGIYTIVTQISTGYGQDQKSVQFGVE
jgi:hypothetical protein